MMNAQNCRDPQSKLIVIAVLMVLLALNASAIEITLEQDHKLVVEEGRSDRAISPLRLNIAEPVLHFSAYSRIIGAELSKEVKRADFLKSVESSSAKKPYSRWLIPVGVVLVSFGITYSLYSNRSS